MKKVLLLTIVSLLFIGVNVAQDVQKAIKDIKEGVIMVRGKHYSQAEPILENSVKIIAGKNRAWEAMGLENLAIAQIELNKVDEGKKNLNKSETIYKAIKADYLIEIKKLATYAEEEYKKIELNDRGKELEEAVENIKKGTSLRKQGRYKEAKAPLESALKAVEGEFLGWEALARKNLGMVQFEIGEKDAGFDNINKSIDLMNTVRADYIKAIKKIQGDVK